MPLPMSNAQVGQGNQGMIGNKPHDQAPSQQRQGANNNKTLSKANQSVMVRNSLDKFAEYPYAYEVDEDAV